MSEAEASPRKKKRLGFRRACIPCRQKKNRCDGRKPRCLGCASRGLRCEYGPSESTQKDFIIPDVTTTSPQRDHARGLHLSRPEESNGLGQTSLSPHQPAFRYPGDPTQRSPDEERERRPSSSIWSGTGAGTSGGNIPSPVSQTLSQPDGYFGDSSSFRFVSKIRPGPHTERSEPTPTIETVLTQDAFESPNSLVQVGPSQRDGFPPQDVADRLVDAHFERVHVFYPFMHEGTFRARYEGLWAENPKDQAEPAVWLAVVNLVFASGYEFVAEQQDNFATLAAPFVNRAKGIIVSHMLTSTNLHLVQALLLLCHYLQGTLQLNECWNLVGLMIRSAVSIGLHLNPTKDGSFSMVAKEERKRAWWGCVVLDRTLSMKFGRPPSIIFDDARDVDLPLDVDDQYITEASIAPRQPWGLPPRLSFFIHTIKLSEIIASVLSRMYGTSRNPQVETNRNLRWSLCPEDSAKLGNAVLLDGHLQAWWDAMPLHLKAEPDLLDGRDFQRQRLVIRMRYLQLRLLLQRPSFVLFCKNEIKDEFLKNVALSSSQVCISTARETILLIHRHYDKQLLNSLSYILHYIFTSLGVLVTVQTMDASLRNLLSSSEDAQALCQGMEFLRSASRNSIIASRYIAMLSKANKALPPQARIESDCAPLGQARNLQPDRSNTSPAVDEEAVATGSDAAAEETQANSVPEHSLPQHGGLDGLVNDFDFTQLDSMFSYDLLFGTGLPQEIVPKDWPPHDGMIL